MKRIVFLITLLLLFVSKVKAQSISSPFITKWSGGTSIQYKVEGAVDYTLYDFSTNAIVFPTTNVSNNLININTGIDSSTTYILHIRFDNLAPVRRFSNINNTSTYLINLKEVIDWGNTQWTSMNNAFSNAINLMAIPITPPILIS